MCSVHFFPLLQVKPAQFEE